MSLWVWTFLVHKRLTHFTPWCNQKFQWLTLLKSSNIFIDFQWCNAPCDLLICCCRMNPNVVEMFIVFVFIVVFYYCSSPWYLLWFFVLLIILMFMFYLLQVFITVLCWCSLFWSMLPYFVSDHHLYVHHVILLCVHHFYVHCPNVHRSPLLVFISLIFIVVFCWCSLP
jgi:hypothetical protein